jgi:hypothetical protein
MDRAPIRHEFVETVPAEREEGVLYVSIEFEVTVHNCFCGCGSKIVLPLSPTDWRLTFDGDTVSLWPSVGNWSYPCQSHYVISRNEIVWAPAWTKKQIDAGRARDWARKAAYYGDEAVPTDEQLPSFDTSTSARRSLWSRLRHPFSR